MNIYYETISLDRKLSTDIFYANIIHNFPSSFIGILVVLAASPAWELDLNLKVAYFLP